MQAFWIADGNYINVAKQSMASLKRHIGTSPSGMDIQCVLGSPQDAGGFDSFVKLTPRKHEFWYQDSVRYFGEMLEALHDEELMYLDCDTYACGPMNEVFELLERFDFVGAHAPLRETTRTRSAPKAFPEINVGVLVFKNNWKVENLFREWGVWYEKYSEFYGNNDQGPLRDALWNWDGRLYVMPPEYNCRWIFGGFAAYEVRMLHGMGNHQQACNKLNERRGMRGWKRGEMR